MLIDQRTGKVTRLQAGDRIQFNLDNHAVSVARKDADLTQETGEEGYSLMPSDGTEFAEMAQLVADAAGLKVEEIRGEEYPTFEFLEP